MTKENKYSYTCKLIFKSGAETSFTDSYDTPELLQDSMEKITRGFETAMRDCGMNTLIIEGNIIVRTEDLSYFIIHERD